jgi:UDP-glucose 4-epimerase
MKKKLLITGAAGYIGSCLFAYLKKKYDVYGLDKVKKNNNKFFYKANLKNIKLTNQILKKLKPDLIIHLAGQSTIDSIKNKKNYIENNQNATANLIKSMKVNGIKKIIFSSTAAVYKSNNSKIFSERSKIKPNNIYGSTKYKCELLIKQSKINYIIFRFFNVCSSIPQLKVGEMHNPETHLIPIAVHKILKDKKIRIYGNTFKTRDGTCIRDYIHIFDLCLAFEKTLQLIFLNKISKKIINLGSGYGYTTLEVIEKIQQILKKKKCKISIVKNRVGDVPALICSYKRANLIIKWKPKNSNLEKIIKDEIHWQRKDYKSIRQFIY